VLERLNFSNLHIWHEYYKSQINFPDDEIKRKIVTGSDALLHTVNNLPLTIRAIHDEMNSAIQAQAAASATSTLQPTQQLQEIFAKFEAYENSAERTPELIQQLNQLLLDSTYDIWIAYCTRKNPQDTSFNHSADVEMVFCVCADQHTPFTTHMGIMRGRPFFRPENRPHKNLAMQLHAFEALATSTVYGPKMYMITRPAQNMTQIIARELSEKQMNDSLHYPADMKSLGDEAKILDYARISHRARQYGSAAASPALPQPEPTDDELVRLYINSQYKNKPLNNLDPHTCYIMPSGVGVEPVLFKKPAWFPYKSNTQGVAIPGENEYLIEGSNPVMVSITFDGLIKYWHSF
jgi:hypothetical protein